MSKQYAKWQGLSKYFHEGGCAFCQMSYLEGVREQRKKTVLTVWIEPEQQEALRALSAQTRVPMAVYYREAVDQVLARYVEVLAANYLERKPGS